LIGFVLLLLVIGIPLAIIMAGILQYADTRDDIREVLTNSVAAQQAVLVDFEHNQKDERMTVLATVRSVDALEESEVEEMAEALQARLDRPVTLEITVLPVVRSDG
jgi:inner membrane protein involved in colicin E2 resistance